MSQSNKKNAEAEAPKKPEKKSININLSFSAVTTFCVVLLCCVSLAFVMGVIVGRGDEPKSHLPHVDTFLPKDEQVGDANQGEAANSVTKPEAMPKEELDYSKALKDRGENAEVPLASASTPVTSSNAMPPAAAPNAPTSPVTNSAPVNTSNQQSNDTIVQPTKPDTTKQVAPAMQEQAKPEIFDFVFQVATFTDENSVDRLRARLEGNGLRTKMEKSGKYLKVMVLMRGNTVQADVLRKLMVDMKLGEPLQRSKSLVP